MADSITYKEILEAQDHMKHSKFEAECPVCVDAWREERSKIPDNLRNPYGDNYPLGVNPNYL